MHTVTSVQLFETLWTAVHQVPVSVEFSRQEYWSELPCPPMGAPILVSNPRLLWLLHCCWILYSWATEAAQSNTYMHIILHFMGIKASCFLLDFLLLSFKEPLLTVYMFSFIWWLFSVSKIICWYNSVLMFHC